MEQVQTVVKVPSVPLKNAKLSASDFYKLIYDPFWIWCKLHASKEEAVEIVDRYRLLQFEIGRNFELEYVKANYPNAVKVDGSDSINKTIKMMLAGVEVIYQPYLVSKTESMTGIGDLLIKDKSHSSKLGDYHYRVEEIKRYKEVKSYHKLQAACYSFMVNEIQGFLPEKITIILEGGKKDFEYKKIEKDFNKYVQLWRDIRDEKILPLPSGIDKTDSPWTAYGNKILLQSNDLTLLPGVGKTYRKKIQEALGIKSILEFDGIKEDAIVKLFDEPAGKSIYWHIQAYKSGKHLPINTKVEVKRKTRNLYFDFETSDGIHPSEPPHVYMIGIWDKEKNQFKYFLGHGKQDEERIFEEFLNYVGDNEDYYLYHWHDFEIGEIDKIIKQYPKLAERLSKIKKSCIDLKEVVKNNFYVPVPDYSIKKVAPFLGFHWRQKDVGAMESMVLYWDWLREGKQELIDKVLKYNEDDCIAMAYIDERLFPNQ